MRQSKIIVIGSSNTDMVIKTETIPQLGETKLGGKFFMNGGGKGANQAVAVSRLGGEVIFVSKIGNDAFGSQTKKNLEKEKINTNYLFVDENLSSGIALIMVSEKGENIIAVAPGANSNLLPKDIDLVKELDKAEILLLQLEIPLETVKHIICSARKNKQKVILNPAPAQILDDELLSGLYAITPNETEASLLTGITVIDETTASMAALELHKKGVSNVIITMGSLGAFLSTTNKSKLIPSTPVKAIDTTAAGDVFNGALTVAISEGMTIEDAVSFANKAAAISVTRMGAHPSIPNRDEIKNI